MGLRNVNDILENVERYIDTLEKQKAEGSIKTPTVRIKDVYGDLSIFDWFKPTLSLADLKKMRAFLKTAQTLGYTGYTCFKVGVTGSANGMWAYKEESKTGFAPDGDFLYKSFTPAYNYWNIYFGEVDYRGINKSLTDYLGIEYDSYKKEKELMKALEKYEAEKAG